MIQIKKTILTLVALIAMTTGAWAQEEYESFDISSGNTNVNGTHFSITGTSGMDEYGLFLSGESVTVTSLNGENITRVEFIIGLGKSKAENITGTPGTNSCTNGNENGSITEINATSVTLSTENTGYTSVSIKQITVYYGAPASTGLKVAWNAASKTGTFDMPGGNVELEPEYYPQAALTAVPTAINDVPATTDGAIVNAGTVANIGETTNAQGTVMYYAVQSSTAPTAPDYDATGWTDKVPTATDFDEGNVYVWYYVKGADGDETSTFNDGAITKLGESGYITLLAAPTYAVTFAEGVNPEPPAEPEWTASPNANVTKGQPVTVTYSGSKKVLGVKVTKYNSAFSTPMTIEAITPGIISVSSPKEGMQYSLDGGVTKTTMTANPTTINVAAGDKVQFYGNGTIINSYNGTKILGSGDGFTCKVYGNIMSLVDETGFATAKTLSANSTFNQLFYQNTTLTDASGLLLPATELASYCYSQMFRDCTSLTAAPELPATKLASNCYRSMFMGCTALTTAPVLLATTLVESCYYQIFTNCSKLATVTCLAESGINTSFSTANWLNGAGTQAQGTKTVYTVSTANWPSGSNSGIPTGWTRVNIDN